MQYCLRATLVVLISLATVVGGRRADAAPEYPSAGSYVVPGDVLAIAAVSTRPSLEPALTVVADDRPLPLQDGQVQARTLVGRLHAPVPGTGDVALRELPWTLDHERNELRAAIAVALRPDATAIKVAIVGEGLAHPLAVRFVGTEEDMARVRDGPTRLEPGSRAYAWSSTMGGSRLVIELARTADAPPGDEERLRVARIAEIYHPADDSHAARRGGSRSKTASACFADVVCEPAFDDASKAIVLLEIAAGDGVYQCSGALLRDVGDGRQRLAVLTAGHCLAGASGVTVYFGYRSQACNGPSPSPLTLHRMTRLAPFLVDPNIDFGLVDLPGPAPAGLTLLGWSAAPLTLGQELVALHHALGGTQAILRARVMALRQPFMSSSGVVNERTVYESIAPGAGMNSGASGAPFINAAGEVRGLIVGATGVLQQCSDGEEYRTQVTGPMFAEVYPAIADYLNGVIPPPPAAPEEGDLRSVGGLTYALLAGYELRFTADRIENTSATAPTGALVATACAAETRESTDCQTLWRVSRDPLPPGGILEPLSITEPYAPPAAGTYYIRFTLHEIETVGARRFLFAQSTRTETWLPPPPKRVCVKYKKGVCKKWKWM